LAQSACCYRFWPIILSTITCSIWRSWDDIEIPESTTLKGGLYINLNRSVDRAAFMNRWKPANVDRYAAFDAKDYSVHALLRREFNSRLSGYVVSRPLGRSNFSQLSDAAIWWTHFSAIDAISRRPPGWYVIMEDDVWADLSVFEAWLNLLPTDADIFKFTLFCKVPRGYSGLCNVIPCSNFVAKQICRLKRDPQMYTLGFQLHIYHNIHGRLKRVLHCLSNVKNDERIPWVWRWNIDAALNYCYDIVNVYTLTTNLSRSPCAASSYFKLLSTTSTAGHGVAESVFPSCGMI